VLIDLMITPAYAQSAPAGPFGDVMAFLPMIAIFVVFHIRLTGIIVFRFRLCFLGHLSISIRVIVFRFRLCFLGHLSISIRVISFLSRLLSISVFIQTECRTRRGLIACKRIFHLNIFVCDIRFTVIKKRREIILFHWLALCFLSRQ